MYWSKPRTGIIAKADMDGSNVKEIISGLISPAGIAVDFDSRRIFWVEWSGARIQSSNLDGTDVQLVLQLSRNTYPWGIAVTGQRLFWGGNSGSLQSSNKSGQDIRTLDNGTSSILHLTLAAPNPVHTRLNHCEKQACSDGICVLTSNSFRCVT